MFCTLGISAERGHDLDIASESPIIDTHAQVYTMDMPQMSGSRHGSPADQVRHSTLFQINDEQKRRDVIAFLKGHQGKARMQLDGIARIME